MKRPKPPSIVTIAIMTLITVVFWTFFSVFRIFTSTQPVDVPEAVLRPINATLDQEALNTLESKNYLEPNEIPDIVYSTPEPVATEEPEEEFLPEDDFLDEPAPELEEIPIPEISSTPIP